MLKSVIFEFSKLRIGNAAVLITQVREKGHLNRPRKRYPYWFIRPDRKARDEPITQENKQFIKELVHETYGPPAIIKGIETYDQSQNKLIKTVEYERHAWTPGVRRTGLIARKIGQYPLWLKTGEKIRTTLLQVVDNRVVKYIPPEQYIPAHKPRMANLQKYGCLLVGAESTDPTQLTKEYCGIFRDSGVMPTRNLARFIISPTSAIPPGLPLNVTHFRVGDFVDVRGKTVYHGFQGVVKRHGFKGMPASHGVTKTHRRPGNIGGGGEKGRVWPGTKLPGHMGNRYRIIKGLKIWRINTKYNVMWVQGSAVPGETNGLVYIYDTILPLRKPTTAPPYPTMFEEEITAENGFTSDDIWHPDVHDFKQETIKFQVKE